VSSIDAIDVACYQIPTDSPEADGTLEWDSTTWVVVELRAGDKAGVGFTYADRATAELIGSHLSKYLKRANPIDTPALWIALTRHIRGSGRQGVSAMAISAIDVALWDLKGKLLNASVLDLLGAARKEIEAYGSGGFTSFTDGQLRDQLGCWAAEGMRAVKMKIGTHPEQDSRRVQIAREAIGSDVRLFVDANGAYSRKQALAFAEQFRAYNVVWFEEPVSADDLDGLRLLRDRAPAGMDIAAGEYGYDAFYFRRMLEHQAVDVMQADATRCGGVTGFLFAAGVAEAFGYPLSAHTAPSLHAHLTCAVPRAFNVEYFHDHACIEHRFLEGAVIPANGMLRPDRNRPGFGWEIRRKDVEPHRVNF
jgi:L-alanine-DL-glutamate epimerase-like enolase superfamily enzyme